MTAPLVIFDCDGVLVDSEPITHRALAADLTRHGLEMEAERCTELFIGGTMASVALRARELGATLPDDWVERFYALMFAELENTVEPIPGVDAALDALDAAGRTYCVASNGPMAKMAITLKRTGLAPRVDGRVFSAQEIGVPKPQPGLFIHAAAMLGRQTGACTVVEDSPSGVRAARAAGMRCLGYAADTPPARLRDAGAQTTFTDMAELPALLGL